MSNDNRPVLIYGGTTEGRLLAEQLCEAGIPCTVCVATEYGEAVLKGREGLRLHPGRMDVGQMRVLTETEDFLAVVDATHPFAAVVSGNIRESIQETEIPYLRLKRDTDYNAGKEVRLQWFTDAFSCAAGLSKTEGNILLTTGSKELSAFCTKELRDRLYVRVLPSRESLALCEKHGICGKQIIAMQGPFSAQMNEALLAQFHISCLVTKESGAAGGFAEKIEAASNVGAAVFVIGNPEKGADGLTLQETLKRVCELAGMKTCRTPQPKLHISLIGMGVGQERLLTGEARERLEQAGVVFGAKRLLEGFKGKKQCEPYYLPEEILPKLMELSGSLIKEEHTAILFSGDTGFYSGAKKLYARLKQEVETHRPEWEICLLPGISSMSYLAAKAGIDYGDAAVVSLHGRKADLLKTVQGSLKTFVLVSNVSDLNSIGALLCEQGLMQAGVITGYQLSYPEEEIRMLTPKECMELKREGLYCCFIMNEKALLPKLLTHGMPDEAFLRAAVPMTKEEVRDISICKLKLTREAVLYDIGSGTGSVALECALLSREITVYAIERNSEASELIRNNCEKLQAWNVKIVKAEAPEGLNELPVPTHVFIGGSGGRIKEILQVLSRGTGTVRIVMNAVTLETVGSMIKLLKEFPAEKEEIVQVQLARSKKAGGYHLMQAENPVFIFSFDLRRHEEETTCVSRES
ncbi:MAG: precorrin-6A reductase [Lachnospiraceae bacterium]